MIDEQIRSRVQAWLEQRGVTLTCTLCGHSDWIPGQVVVIPEYTHEGIGRAEGLPAVPIVCNHCAQVVFLAAIPIGLVGP